MFRNYPFRNLIKSKGREARYSPNDKDKPSEMSARYQFLSETPHGRRKSQMG